MNQELISELISEIESAMAQSISAMSNVLMFILASTTFLYGDIIEESKCLVVLILVACAIGLSLAMLFHDRRSSALRMILKNIYSGNINSEGHEKKKEERKVDFVFIVYRATIAVAVSSMALFGWAVSRILL